MKTQREIMEQWAENKCVLLDEIEKCGGKPMNRENAEYLCACGGAYAALCMLEKARKHVAKEAGTPSAYAKGGHSMTEEEMESWVNCMENADGSVGAHWTLEKTEQVRTQRGICCDPMKFWASMNMMYSDYCTAAKENNASTVAFYADMAVAFLDDADAQPDKLARYRKYVAKH